MLQFIRERAQSWIAWVIIGLIIIPFALWGVNEYIRSDKDHPAAMVNGNPITQQQVQRAFYDQRERIAQMFGGKINPDLISEEQIRKQALTGLVDQELLLEAAADTKLRVGDVQLAERIREVQAFQEKGSFSMKRYEQVLSRQGMSPQAFENSLRRDAAVRQLQAGVGLTGFATPAEAEAQRRLAEQQRDVGYLVIPSSRFADTGEIPAAELQGYYDAHPTEFMQPERVKVNYVELSRAQLAAGITIPDEKLRERYDAHQSNYKLPEQRRASHILVTVSQDAEPAKVEEAQKKAEGLKAQLDKGANFSELAKKNSEDPGSAAQGGDLGAFGRGVMVKPFEDAVFSLVQAGQITGPVRSQFGFHIIRLDEIRPEKVQSFEEAKPKLLEEARNEAADEKLSKLADTLTNLSYEHPESLEPAASALGLTIKESPFITRTGGQGLFAQPKVVNAAFSEEVQGGNNSEVLELDGGRLLVLHLLDHQSEAKLSFEEAKPAISERMKKVRVATKAKEAAEAAAEKLRQGTDPVEVAGEVGGEWKRVQAKRQDSAVPGEISRALFAMARPADGKPSVQPVALGSGDQAVVQLFGVKDPEPEAATADKAKAKQLADDNGQASMSAMMDGLRARAKIVFEPK